ncbi:Metallo-peptidase family M12-domain-containing protein [Mycotypha africana]|uniref:Metallo-peptidase family M12-domain-containing protein n=1 Tax=Mycotypha africana TaxID=64632 RepID=UPI00230007E9|nr:Metallo-peptidase family M12-domain-containing protein [Mycotypha africana]KAI8975115.1 Metallo-peptidase family M12-domain-containing protein [Mycotypha africana]
MLLIEIWMFVILFHLADQVKGLSRPSPRLSKVDIIQNPRITSTSSQPLDRRHFTFNSNQQFYHCQQNCKIEFMVFEQPITLSLSPNNELFHPNARLEIFNSDGSIQYEEHLDTTIPTHYEKYPIFKGYVNNQQNNWARITFRHDLIEKDVEEFLSPASMPQGNIDNQPLLFEGAFQLDSDIYHIKTSSTYKLAKRIDDPETDQHTYGSQTMHMVIYRDSDLVHEYTSDSLFRKRESVTDKKDTTTGIQSNDTIKANDSNDAVNDLVMCAMEELAYNRRMTGTYPMNPNTPSSGNSSVTEFSNLWEKRDFLSMSTTPGSGSSPTFSTTTFTNGCPTARKIAYIGAAADCSYVLFYGSTRYAKLQMINDWNVASAVFEKTFNVSLGLIYLQLSVPECPSKPRSDMNWNQACSNYYTINERLSDFSLWRGKRGEDGAALWHLMTRCSTGVKVGIAWLSQLCETQVSQQIEEDGSTEWVSGTGVSSITRDEWKVVAHEIGHGFGAIHDCTAHMCPCQGECGCCPLSDAVCSAGETYLMNPTSNVTTNEFSPCSISDICNAFPSIGYCLNSPDVRKIDVNSNNHHHSFSLCGNGILEPGEECDSGLTDSACCFAKTCKLKPGALCDDYSNQCCLNCAIAPKGTVCRPAVSECDSTEYCTGESSQCPADLYDTDGTLCANGTMKCASGVCTSRDLQCMTRGLRQNISEQCSFQKDSCLISCTDPKDPKNCLMLSGMFLDGTECGLAGYCQKGACVSTGALNTLKAWTEQNKSLAIPIYIFGSIAVLIIVGWIFWFCRRRYNRRRVLLLSTGAVASADKDKDSRPNSLLSNNINIPTIRNSQIIPYNQHHDISAVNDCETTIDNTNNNNSQGIDIFELEHLSSATTSTANNLGSVGISPIVTASKTIAPYNTTNIADFNSLEYNHSMNNNTTAATTTIGVKNPFLGYISNGKSTHHNASNQTTNHHRRVKSFVH